MDFYELTFCLRNKMLDKKRNLTFAQEEKCLILAALISYKIINSEIIHEFRPDSNELLRELHLLNYCDELFSNLPFGDADIIEIIDSCCR